MGITIDLDPELCHLPTGSHNAITDVPGVRVGHVTLSTPDGVHTGVTAIVPPGDCFLDKLPAAAYVSNGFGKSMGLMQIQELGTLETPILLTNTFACGACFDALVDYSLSRHPEIGVSTSTVNPVVLECNDGPINRIRERTITARHGLEALEGACDQFAEGDVGGGTGMTCFDLKGGIGSASRIMRVAGRDYTLGIVVMTNFGSMECFRLAGRPIGAQLAKHQRDACERPHQQPQPHQQQQGERGHVSDIPDRDMGSIVAVIATDLPLNSRQLHRLSKRVTVGIARCGGYIGDGSGEIVVSFSTANRMHHWMDDDDDDSRSMLESITRLNEYAMDDCFRVVTAISEEAIISSLMHAHSVIGWTGESTPSLLDAVHAAGMTLFDGNRAP